MTNLEIVFRKDTDIENIRDELRESVREFIEDKFGIEIVEIN